MAIEGGQFRRSDRLYCSALRTFVGNSGYWFTGLNPSKDRPPGDIQKKSWTIPQIRCRILFVFQGHQSAAAYSRTHGGVGSYSTGARSGPETVGAVRGREAALTGEGRTPAQGE